MRRVGTASSCPRVTVDEGEKHKLQENHYLGFPNFRGHKKRAHSK